MGNQEKINQHTNFLIAKKSEKVATAIYLISQFLSDQDDLKHKLRIESNQLLSTTNHFAYREDQDIFQYYETALASVSVLISYLTLAMNTNLISRMNCQITIDSLRILERTLSNRKFELYKSDLKILEEENLVNNNFLEKDGVVKTNTSYDALTDRNMRYDFHNFVSPELDSKKEDEVENIYKGQSEILKDSVNVPTRYGISSRPVKKTKSKTRVRKREDSIENIERTPNKKANANNTLAASSRKIARKEEIFSLFAPGREVSINDISNRIIGCSTKTIQRELNDLMAEQRIEKIGDRRWSKYILA